VYGGSHRGGEINESYYGCQNLFHPGLHKSRNYLFCSEVMNC
jgi:hypothetical protein